MNGDDPKEVLIALEFLKKEMDTILAGGEGREIGGLKGGIKIDTTKSQEDIRAKIDELEKKLIKITSAKEFQDFMKPILAFKKTALYRYSIVNSILIVMQDPEATAVLSGRKWADKNREIVDGAKMISLWVPKERKEWKKGQIIWFFLRQKGKKNESELTPEEREELKEFLNGTKRWAIQDAKKFDLLPFFTDIRFTKVMEGKEDKMADWEKGKKNLNDLVWFDDKQEATESTVEIANALAQVCKNHKIDLDYEDIKSGARGYATNGGKTIRLKSGEEVTFDFLKTAVHELTHALCHFKDSEFKMQDAYEIQEQEAEICAWIVCYLFGYEDPNNTSLNYVGGWGITDEKKAVNIFKKMNAIATKIYDEIINEIKKQRGEK